MSPTIHEQILTDLDATEREEGVRILYACESGSRVWGYASPESDYDVFFMYIRQPEWYLTIDVEHRRDVLQRAPNDQIELNGWDVRKALKLLIKSNPPLLEWLQSPLIYRNLYGLVDELRPLLPEYCSPMACHRHYWYMARNNYREHLSEQMVLVKKYFHVLRPLLAVLWTEEGRGLVPIAFQTLVDEMVPDAAVRQAIDDLLVRKQASQDTDQEPRDPVIRKFMKQHFRRLENTTPEYEKPQPDVERLNHIFRALLDRVWHSSSTV